MQIKGLASAATTTENSPDRGYFIEDRSITWPGDLTANESDMNTTEDAWGGQQTSNRSLKRSLLSSTKRTSAKHSSSTLGHAPPKKSKTNEIDKIITSSNENTKTTKLLVNNNQEHSLDSTDLSHVISSADIQTSHSSLSEISGSIVSTLRIKEESGQLQSDLAHGVDGGALKARSSYIQQSEHVVIPTDPSLMEGTTSMIS